MYKGIAFLSQCLFRSVVTLYTSEQRQNAVIAYFLLAVGLPAERTFTHPHWSASLYCLRCDTPVRGLVKLKKSKKNREKLGLVRPQTPTPPMQFLLFFGNIWKYENNTKKNTKNTTFQKKKINRVEA